MLLPGFSIQFVIFLVGILTPIEPGLYPIRQDIIDVSDDPIRHFFVEGITRQLVGVKIHCQ